MNQALCHAVRNYIEASYIEASAVPPGIAATPLRGISVMWAYAPTSIMKSVYKPLICLILQGAKQLTAGPGTYDFAAGQSLIVSADVPASSRITRASRAEP